MRRVDPKHYTKHYYLTDCTGFREYKQTWGIKLEPRLEEMVKKIPLPHDLRVLDIGCGRGELVFWSIRNGASKSVGIDYSKAAIDLARNARAHMLKSIQKKCSFLLMDAKLIKFPANSFDAIFLTEILEHLYPQEQDQVFKEICRVLKPSGYLFIHTSPSRIFIDFTYPYISYPVGVALVKIWNVVTKSNYPLSGHPSTLRSASHKIMHVAEPDYFSLKRLFIRHGFRGRIKSSNITINKPILSKKDRLFNFLTNLSPLSNYPPFNIIFGNDFYALLRRK